MPWVSCWKAIAHSRLAVRKLDSVVLETTRSGCGVCYQVRVRFDGCRGPEDDLVVWSDSEVFGLDDAHSAGGFAFVEKAREQAAAAAEVWEMVRKFIRGKEGGS